MSTEATNPQTFTEYLFFYIPAQVIDSGDIAVRFSKQNQQQREWPIAATEMEEIEIFLSEQAIRGIAAATANIAKELQNRDFDDFMRLVHARQKQIEANLKSSLFALRTVWKDWEAFKQARTN